MEQEEHNDWDEMGGYPLRWLHWDIGPDTLSAPGIDGLPDRVLIESRLLESVANDLFIQV
jgi:hypothetical protein